MMDERACLCTWIDAEVDVVSPHAGGRVCDSVHMGEELHGTQRVPGSAAVPTMVMFQVALWMEKYMNMYRFIFTGTDAAITSQYFT